MRPCEATVQLEANSVMPKNGAANCALYIYTSCTLPGNAHYKSCHLFAILFTMDLVLRIADEYMLDSLWACLVPLNDTLADRPFPTTLATNASRPQSAWPRDYIPRQLLSLTLVTLIGINLIYFIFATISFQFIFNHELMRHPRFLKNQIKFEIETSLKSIPAATLLMVPWFQAEVMGYSRLYDDVSKHGWLYFAFSIPLYVSLH